MTKGKIITLSILLFVITLIGVLFGVVFCLRQQEVTVIGESPITPSREEIVSTAGLKKGKSIFMLDKEKAINNIEQKYPYLKVVQIKTKSVTKIDIRVRARHKTYYTKAGTKYFVMDEDLKVLEVSEVQPLELIYIKENTLNINSSSTLPCDFVGTKKQTQTLNGLFKAMYTQVVKEKDANGNNVYFTRQEICTIIKEVELKSFDTFDKIIATTSYGVKLDIENSTKEINKKINICFALINENNYTKGTLKLFNDLDGELKYAYFEE